MSATTEQQPRGAERFVERPTAAFVLSLIAGVCILAGSGAVMMATFPVRGAPYYYGGMMGGYYGGMMGGYYGMMNGLGFAGGWMYGLGAIGIVSGVIILMGAIMLYNRPEQAAAWGTLVLVFSAISFFGMGGFFVGAILGLVGGILALSFQPRSVR